MQHSERCIVRIISQCSGLCNSHVPVALGDRHCKGLWPLLTELCWTKRVAENWLLKWKLNRNNLYIGTLFLYEGFMWQVALRNTLSTGHTTAVFSLSYFWRVQNPSCSLTNPLWGYSAGTVTVPSLKGTTRVMWCGQYLSKSQQHDRKCTATHQY